MESFPLEPNPEGVKLRERLVAQHPTMKVVIDKHKADGLNSLIH
jgi:hypothetical protein